VRNLREVACTAHFAVPRFYELLMPYLRRDPVLRQTFFRHVKLLFYAAAGLGQRFWDELRDVAIDSCGEEILIASGYGSTETAPFAFRHRRHRRLRGLDRTARARCRTQARPRRRDDGGACAARA
jgi:long-subunit acyl-CoA synthetase (AMP-forming)